MDHYLTVPLNAPYLQGSSLGPPYVKWATVTNSNFEMLRFCTYNLLRYTSRLWHETEHRSMRDQRLHSEATKRSNAYTSPIVMHRVGRGSVGYRAMPDEVISVTSIRSTPPQFHVTGRGTSLRDMQYVRVEVVAGREVEVPIDQAEGERLTSPLVEDHIRIHDRSVLHGIRQTGHDEIGHLTLLHHRFADACRRVAKKNDPLTEFSNLNEDYWI